ncbi:MAG: NVEALA domain-containing protein [Clostridiales bacterium]|jgi:hypothetical protein|nr:NVEALA domain-containing protein [Clostridiales bacterium]
MKRIIFNFKMLILLVFVMGGLSWFIGNERQLVTDLTKSNVEALAGGEGGDHAYCYGYGEIECFGNRVEMRIDMR